MHTSDPLLCRGVSPVLQRAANVGPEELAPRGHSQQYRRLVPSRDAHLTQVATEQLATK